MSIWDIENTKLLNDKIKIKLPQINDDTYDITLDVSDKYYPVAIYDLSQRVADGTENGEKF